MGHLLKLKCALGTVNARILASTSVPFRPTTMQKLPNLALIETKRITVYLPQSERLSKHFYKTYSVVIIALPSRIESGEHWSHVYSLQGDDPLYRHQDGGEYQHSRHQPARQGKQYFLTLVDMLPKLNK
jgi:hypothetical protein